LVLVVLEQGLGQRQVGGRFGECRLQAQRLLVGGNAWANWNSRTWLLPW
jgi:hypothetical protein